MDGFSDRGSIPLISTKKAKESHSGFLVFLMEL